MMSNGVIFETMNTNHTIDKRLSDTIKAMRFPLIVLVVFAHSLGFESVEIQPSLDKWNVYHFFSEMISHNFCKIAVCWFFVFSGYLFFYNMGGEFSWKTIADKWKKRCSSLLRPYVIWNLLVVVAIVVKSFVFNMVGLGPDEGMEWVKKMNVLDWLWNWPANFPLWYMRDLVLLTLLAPVWFFIFKKFKWFGFALLICAYASPLNPGIPSMRGIFFFGLGAFLGIWQYNLLTICRKVRIPAAILAVVTLLVSSYWNASPYHEWLLRLFYPFGMMTFMNICDKLADKDGRRERMCKLAGAVFFIYGSHEIFILGWTKGLCLRAFGDSFLGTVASFFIVPVVVLLVCLALYKFFDRFTPRTLSFVCGGRANKPASK